MADIDSAGSANRQIRRPAPRRTPRRSTPIRVGSVKRRVRNTRSTRSNRGRVISSERNKGRRGALMRRRDSRSTGRTSRSAPKTPPPGNSKLITPPAPPKPVIPDINKYLGGDSTYQRQLAAYARSLADFQAEQGLARTDYNTNYQNTYRDIGLSKTDALGDLENDFASRGMLKSSLYNEGLGDLNEQYQNQYGDLSKQRLSFLDQLGQDYRKYGSEQTVGKQNARAEAIRRRAEKYGL